MPDTTITADTKRFQEMLATPDPGKRRAKALEKEEKDTQDVLLAGQEDAKKAQPHVEKQAKEMMAEEKSLADDVRNKLEMHKGSTYGYLRELAEGLRNILMTLDWVRGWTADVVVTKAGGAIRIKGKPFATKEGILLVVTTPDGRVMHQGMRSTGEPILDYAGIYTLALQAENTMDKERGLLLDGHNGDSSAIVGKDGRPIPIQSRTNLKS